MKRKALNLEFDQIKKSPLFKGIRANECNQLLTCLGGQSKHVEAGESVLLEGNPIHTIGLVLSGSIHISKSDLQGNMHLLAELGAGDTYGEVFVCAGIAQSPVTVTAARDCDVLQINCRKLLSVCSSACKFHNRLIQNLLELLAQRNILLNQKLEILSKRTIRDRLLLYLSLCSAGAKMFTIPLNREELAAYLCVDRSALSNELSKMRQDGLIQYRKNQFEWTCSADCPVR